MSSRITAVRPLVGRRRRPRHHRRRRLRRRSASCRRSASAGQPARLARRLAARADGARARPGLDGGHTPVRVEEAPRRDRLRRDRRAARDRAAPGRQPGLRSRRQPLRDVQRLARPAGAGLDLRRPAGRLARAVRRRTCRIRRRWPSIATGRLHVSSRFDGSVHRVDADGRSTIVATDLGVACGIAFGAGRRRSSSAIAPARSCASRDGRATLFASIPPSVAAFHLAFGPDGWLYVAAPTLAVARRRLSRLARRRRRDVPRRLRPSAGARVRQRRPTSTSSTRWPGASGVYRIRVRPAVRAPSSVIAGGALLGLAFDPRGGLVVVVERHRVSLRRPLRGLLTDRATGCHWLPAASLNAAIGLPPPP